MPSHFLQLSLICILLLLNACSLISKKEHLPESTITVYDRQSIVKQLETMDNWQILGKINIRNPEESLTAAINSWKQTGQEFNIDLSSTFFGMGATNISGTPFLIKFHEAGENPLYSDNPDELMHKALGLPLPISHLSNWIKGLPVPGIASETSYDSNGLPKQLTQDGWSVQYSSYHFEYTIPLPRKIKLSREHTRITLAIKEWTLRSP